MSNNQALKDIVSQYQPGFSLSSAFYSDPDVYRSDLETIFYRKWIYAGHISQLPETGWYFLLEFAGESIIVARGEDDQVRAFANVCRHRGSKVCLKKSAKVRSFVCPYHAWTYELDGSLRTRRAMPEVFDQKAYGLKPVSIGQFHGMIFINLDVNAPNLEEGFNAMDESFAIYDLAKTKIACEKTFSVDANWKLVLENFMECYHCAPAHPEYSCSHALKNPKDYAALRPAMLKKAAELGYQTESLDNSVPDDNSVQYFYNRSSLYEPYVTGSETGEPVAPLLGDIKDFGGGAADLQLGPLTYAILYPDHGVIYRFLARDVQQTDMDIIWLVNESAQEGKDYDIEKLTWLWTVTSEADKTIILNNQKGVNSRFYQPGPLSEMEHYTNTFITWYLGQVSP